MDPDAFGHNNVLEVEVLCQGLAHREDSCRVQAHGLLQARLQVGQLGHIIGPKRVCAICLQLLRVQEGGAINIIPGPCNIIPGPCISHRSYRHSWS